MAVGALVPYARADYMGDDDDWRDVPVYIRAADAVGDEFLRKQAKFLDRLRTLRAAGLGMQHTFTLLRTWAQGACVHLQRAIPFDKNSGH